MVKQNISACFCRSTGCESLISQSEFHSTLSQGYLQKKDFSLNSCHGVISYTTSQLNISSLMLRSKELMTIIPQTLDLAKALGFGTHLEVNLWTTLSRSEHEILKGWD